MSRKFLAAFLDDMFTLSPAPTARVTGWTPSPALSSAGPAWRPIWERHGHVPMGILEPGFEAWRGEATNRAQGCVGLGMPIGHGALVAAQSRECLAEKPQLLDELPLLPDVSRSQFLILFWPRTVLPAALLDYARQHDDGVSSTRKRCIG